MGEGATFTFYIEEKATQDSTRLDDLQLLGPAAELSFDVPPNILIVEDDPTNHKLASKILGRLELSAE